MKHKVALLFLFSVSSSLTHLAGKDYPWDEPYTTGQALFHFDTVADRLSPDAISPDSAAALSERATIDPQNKVHGSGSARFSGGHAVIDRFPWTANLIRSIECFVRIQKFPARGDQACLFAMTGKGRKPVCTLHLLPDGGLELRYAYSDHLQAKYREQGVLKLPPGSLVKEKWQHLAIQYFKHNGFLMMRAVLDGTIVEEEYAGFIEPQTVRLYLGNSPEGSAPFSGWIDELRCSSAFGFLPPTPPDDWTDPQAMRPRFDDPRFYPGRDEVLFYASFDALSNTKRPFVNPETIAPGTEIQWGKSSIAPQTGPGVRGHAVELGFNLSFPALGNVRGDSGTVCFWLLPKTGMAKLGTLFKCGNSKGAFWVSGTHGLYVHIPRHPDGKYHNQHRVSGNGWWTLGVNLQENRWHHIALTWQGEWSNLYFDGVKQDAHNFLIPGGFAPVVDEASKVEIGDSWRVREPGSAPQGYLDEYLVFSRAISAEEVANLYRWARNENPLPVRNRHSRFDCYPSRRRIVVTVDQTVPGIDPGQRLHAELRNPKGALACETVTSRSILSTAELVLGFPPLPPGNYTVRVTQKNARDETVIADSFVYHHADHDFLRQNTGVTDQVLPPWTPVEVSDNTIRLLGREVALSSLGLPESITVGERPLLAGPMVLELEREHGEASNMSVGSTLRRRETSPKRVVFEGKAVVPELVATVRNTTEYEGTSRIEMELAAGALPGPIQRLALVIPLNADAVRYVNARGFGWLGQHVIGALPRREGLVFGSHIMPESGHRSGPLELLSQYEEWNTLRQQGKPLPKAYRYFTTHTSQVSSGSFLPYLWVGSPEMGLCWFADTDEGWVRGSMDVPAIEIRNRRDRGVVELRVNLIGHPTMIEGERKVVFGLLPTPARPLLPGWRKRYWRQPTILGFQYPWASGRIYKGKGCPGAYWGEPFPRDWGRAEWFRNIANEKGWIQVPYMEFSNLHDYDIPKYMINEWRVQPFGWRLQGGIFPGEGYADWFCYWFDQYVRRIGIDGVYFDNVRPLPSLNEHAHGAWRDADGRLQSTYNLWAMRDFFRRVRTVLLQSGVEHPWIEYHMTHTHLAHAMCYGDMLLDGEHGATQPGGADFMDRWSLDRLTAIDSPHSLGVPTRFIASLKGPWDYSFNWDRFANANHAMRALRTGAAALLLVDCLLDHWMLSATLYRDMLAWGVGEENCRFIGHWKDRFKSSDKDLKVAAWTRPDAMLLVISNFSHEEKKARISFSPAGLLSLPANQISVAGAETREVREGQTKRLVPWPEDLRCKLAQDGAVWLLSVEPVPPRDFRLVKIMRREAPGK